MKVYHNDLATLRNNYWSINPYLVICFLLILARISLRNIKRIFYYLGFSMNEDKKSNEITWEFDFKEKGIPKYADWFKVLKKAKSD